MWKRPGAGGGGGGGKRARLDVTISEHAYPLSQHAPPADEWGDDNDDEILLLASQACEEVTDRDISALPDYSAWIQKPSTSTQQHQNTQKNIYAPSTSKAPHFSINDSFARKESAPGFSSNIIPGTSRGVPNYKNSLNAQFQSSDSNFKFKKPVPNPVGGVSNTELMRDRCTGIASPLPGITSNSMKDNMNGEDLIHSEKDTAFFYKKLLQMQEENAKLKSEHGKLLERCLTKDGEVSILRTQLKTSQAAMDNARLDKLRAHEKLQLEWTEKLDNVNKEARNLKTQLDFKNLELLSVKEKCRSLELNKVKMTQVTVSGHDRSMMSQRQNKNGSFGILDDFNRKHLPAPKCQVSTTGAQTEKLNSFVKLNPAYRSAQQTLPRILPLLLQPSQKQPTLLASYDKLQPTNEYARKSTSHRPVTTDTSESWGSLCGELADGRISNLGCRVETFLAEVLGHLKCISQKVTTAFLRDMDEKYIQESVKHERVIRDQLYAGKALFKEEQAISARRATAALAALCVTCESLREYVVGGKSDAKRVIKCTDSEDTHILGLMESITSHVGEASCAIQYSGLLLSFIFLLEVIVHKSDNPSVCTTRICSLVKNIIMARPSLEVVCEVLSVLRILSCRGEGSQGFCVGRNLKMDIDQGLVMYEQESCFLQVLLRQLETLLKSIERRGQSDSVVFVAQQFISFYRNSLSLGHDWCQLTLNSSCYCSLLLAQVMVYMLHICAVMLMNTYECIQQLGDESVCEALLTICRCGVAVLYLWTLRESEFNTLLGHYEGYYHLFVELCQQMREHVVLDEIQGNILSELVTTLQPNMEDIEPLSSPLNTAWVDSFSRFSVVD